MERLTIEGLFCDIAQCTWPECGSGVDEYCDARKVYEKLRDIEIKMQQGKIVEVDDAEGVRDIPKRDTTEDS